MNAIKEYSGLVALAVVVIFVAFSGGSQESAPTESIGAAGGQYVEQYLPVVRYNGGLATELPFDMDGTSANLAVGGTLGVTGVSSLQANTNKIGTANSVNYLYFGAGDGCSAIAATASGTLTTTATSTAFCN